MATQLSYSRYQTFSRCPWKYHLVYDLGWRSGPSDKAAVGQSLHKTVAKFLELPGGEKTETRLYETFDAEWVNEGFSSPQETFEAYEEGKKMLKNFFEWNKTRKPASSELEKEFSISIEPDILFHATIDRLDFFNDGSYEIVEYKTNDQNWTEERLENDLQLSFYDFSVRKLLNTDSVRLGVYFLSTGRFVNVQRTSRHREMVMNRLTEVADQLRQKNDKPNLENCCTCEFSRRCEYSSLSKKRN